MTHHADIDLDFGNRDEILNLIKHIPAQITSNNKTKKHNSGVYIQPIPINPVTGFSSIDYKEADKRGYFKLDFLNVTLYNKIKSYEHYERLLSLEPNWDMLVEKQFTEQIIHIGSYYDTIKVMMPDSIIKMAMFIAAIRPAKKHLLYKSWDEIEYTIWDKPDTDKYYFKKSHGIAYSMLVALHMNLINFPD